MNDKNILDSKFRPFHIIILSSVILSYKKLGDVVGNRTMATRDDARTSKSTSIPIIPPLAMLDKENTRENVRTIDTKTGKEKKSPSWKSKNSRTVGSLRALSPSTGVSPQIRHSSTNKSSSVTPLRSHDGLDSRSLIIRSGSATSKREVKRRVLRYGETVESLFCLDESSSLEHRRLCNNIVDGLIVNEASSWRRAIEYITKSISSSNHASSKGGDLIRLHRRATSRFSLESHNGSSEDVLALWLSYAKSQAKYGSREEAKMTFQHIQKQRIARLDASFYLALASFQRVDKIEQAIETLRLGVAEKANPVQKLKDALVALKIKSEKDQETSVNSAEHEKVKRASLEQASLRQPVIPPLPTRPSVDRRSPKKRRSSSGSSHSKLSPKRSRSLENTEESNKILQKRATNEKMDDSMSTMSLDKSNLSMDIDLSLSASPSMTSSVVTDPNTVETLLHSQKRSIPTLSKKAVGENIDSDRFAKAKKKEKTSPIEPIGKREEESHQGFTPRTLTKSVAINADTHKATPRMAKPPPTKKYSTLRSKQLLLTSKSTVSRLSRVGLSGKAQRVNPENSYIEDSECSGDEADHDPKSLESKDVRGKCTPVDRESKKPASKITKMDLSYMLNWDPTSRQKPSIPSALKGPDVPTNNGTNIAATAKDEEASLSGPAASRSVVTTSSTIASAVHSSDRKSIHSNVSNLSDRTGETTGSSINGNIVGLSNITPKSNSDTGISPETVALVARSNSDFLPLVCEDNILHVNNIPYAKLGVIGKGGSCKVYRALSKECSVLAIKKVKLGGMDKKAIDGYANEIALLKRLRGNPAIIQMHDSEVDLSRKAIFLVMELGEVDLNQVLHQQTLLSTKGMGDSGEQPRLNMNFIRLTWQQMLGAVHCIHEERIIHGDLKPANFLFVRGALKLIDFGIAKAIQSDDTNNIYRESQIGTLNYMSPESILDTGSGEDGARMKCGRASDIWSLGCILYQMVYGRTPFAELHMIQKLQAIVNPNHKIRFPDDVDAAAIDAMKLCLLRDPEKRPPIVGDNGLLNEHWFLHSHRRPRK